MKIIPRNNQIIGRVVVKAPKSTIVRIDETKVTKFVLVDAIGSGAEASGIKVGDLIVPTALSHLVLEGGDCLRPVLEEANVGFFVTGMDMRDFHVQVNNASKYVPFDSKDAAQSIGAQAESGRKTEAA